MKVILKAHVGEFGLTPDEFVLEHAAALAADLKVRSCAGAGAMKEEKELAVREVRTEGSLLHIFPEPFDPLAEYSLVGTASASDLHVSGKEIALQIADVELFQARSENNVNFRLYSPKAQGARPLILYLHGGGECGTDNLRQLTGTFGAIQLAKLYPDMYVMAPQAPLGLLQAGVPLPDMSKMKFSTSDMPGLEGWSRPLLSDICDIIRGMIAAGDVNPSRVYVTGLSMGGGGTLRALSVGADLFAAGAPICPTMTPETFRILCGLTHTKLWISSAYVDHTIYRHKYIVDGILALRDAGNRDAHLTLYSPEELEAYGISTDPSLSLSEKFGQNHASWVLTYHNEHGILSWLTEQVLERYS